MFPEVSRNLQFLEIWSRCLFKTSFGAPTEMRVWCCPGIVESRGRMSATAQVLEKRTDVCVWVCAGFASVKSRASALVPDLWFPHKSSSWYFIASGFFEVIWCGDRLFFYGWSQLSIRMHSHPYLQQLSLQSFMAMRPRILGLLILPI